ncbi:MAG: HAD family hydrolase [Clostridia bacterium]|nr:HAD family hydrolase [Clostridia bacterium]
MPEASNVKLICMDMDGTLLANGGIPEINIRALRECRARGIRLALVSGRNFRFLISNAAEICDEIAIISANGARIDLQPGEKCIYEGVFEEGYAREVCETLYETGVYFEIYTSTKNYVFNRERISKIHKHSLEMYLKNRQILGLEFPDEPSQAEYGGIYKFVAFSDESGMMDKVKRALDDRHIEHSSSWWDNCEVMAKGVDKGSAVKILCAHFGIDPQEAMAFGDHTNDIALLKAVGYPVAMGNAVDETKAVAKYIAPANTEGGVGRLIYDKVLGYK